MGPLELSLESSSFVPDKQALNTSLSELSNSFESSVSFADGTFDGFSSSFDDNLAAILQVEDASAIVNIHSSMMDSAKRMLDGVEDALGNETLSLRKISEWKLNDDPIERVRNIKQHAGYAAEVISTELENMRAAAENLDVRTHRADDLPDLFKKNDQYVDKIRVNAAGEIIERIQTKFIGKDGADWVSKMINNKKYDKYFDDNRVDKIECPKNYYDEAKAAIQTRIEDQMTQLDRVIKEGKTDVAEKIQRRIDKLNKLDDMIEQSLVTTDQAEYAVLHPDRLVQKLFVVENLKNASREGLESGVLAAALTFTVSTTTHMGEFLDGEITAEELARVIAMETGTAGAAAAATDFVTTAIANSLQTSSSNLIRTLGGSCLPAVVVSFAVESYDSVTDYAQGIIDADELAYDLGHNAAALTGSTYAGMKAGALVGTTFGPAGTLVGGIAGGLVGATVASGIYTMAVEYVPGAASEIAQQIEVQTNAVIEQISEQFPDQLPRALTLFNDYYEVNNIPVRLVNWEQMPATIGPSMPGPVTTSGSTIVSTYMDYVTVADAIEEALT